MLQRAEPLLALSIGTRKSMSECSTSVGVFTFFAYFSGDAFQ
jgi:hypothetical protein